MARDEVFCNVCKKQEPRKIASKHEKRAHTAPYPSTATPSTSAGPRRTAYAELARDSDNEREQEVHRPPSPLPPLPSETMNIDIETPRTFRVTVEDVDEDEESDEGDATGSNHFDSDDDGEDEVEYDNFVDVDWDALARQVESLSSLEQMGGEYERHLADLGASQLNAYLHYSHWNLENKLTELDIRICKAFVCRVRHNLTDSAFEDIPAAFSSSTIEEPLPSLASCRSRMSLLSGFVPEFYDCCLNSCCCFVAQYAEMETCPFCKELRYNADGFPRQRFMYLPIIPRLVQFTASRNMAANLRERQNRTTDPNEISDIFDGSHFHGLCERNIRVRGEEIQPLRKYFADIRDLAIGLSTDGFCPHRRRKTTAWPLIAFLYDLPPDTRFHLDNIISLGVIPGPKKPKDMDSFLYMFVCEMERLAVGVRAIDSLEPDVNKAVFSLRAFLIAAFGDIPAVSALMGMKGHNAYSPCRMCEIVGVPAPGGGRSTTLYVPLDRSNHPGLKQGDVPIYDPLDLPLRTHDRFIAQAEEIMACSRVGEADALARKYGVKHLPILASLDSLSFPASFPYDFMHLIWENLVKNLVLLWTDDFKGLDSGTESYTVEKAVWEGIGKLTAGAGAHIPSVYGARVPDIATDRSNMSAEMWSFWTLFLGPILLRPFLKAEYHAHFVTLVSILNKCLQFSISLEEVEGIRNGLAQWAVDYER